MDWAAAFHGLAGGLMIGLSAVWLMATLGRIAGISGIVSGLLSTSFNKETGWRICFVIGLICGPVLVSILPGIGGNVVGNEHAVVGAPVAGIGLMIIAGILVGVGTGLGSGCTSGHGVCGIARVSPRSITATLTFLATGMLTVYLLKHSVGGGL